MSTCDYGPKLIDFETTLPTAIEELMQQQKERQRA